MTLSTMSTATTAPVIATESVTPRWDHIFWAGNTIPPKTYCPYVRSSSLLPATPEHDRVRALRASSASESSRSPMMMSLRSRRPRLYEAPLGARRLPSRSSRATTSLRSLHLIQTSFSASPLIMENLSPTTPGASSAAMQLVMEAARSQYLNSSAPGPSTK